MTEKKAELTPEKAEAIERGIATRKRNQENAVKDAAFIREYWHRKGYGVQVDVIDSCPVITTPFPNGLPPDSCRLAANSAKRKQEKAA